MSAFYVPIRRLVYLTLGALLPSSPLITILCYHSISDDNWDFSVSPAEFKKQIFYLSSRYQFISLSDLHAYILGKRSITHPSIILTFDDGYSDIYQIKDFLGSLKIYPTVFALADPVNANAKELGTQKKFLSTNQIKKLVANGWEIGSHTATHPAMPSLNPVQIQHEIIDSKKSLEAKLKMKVKYFAYPKGRYTPQIISSVAKAGYSLALTMNDEPISPDTHPLKIPRIGVDGTHAFAEFKVLNSPLVAGFRRLLKSYANT